MLNFFLVEPSLKSIGNRVYFSIFVYDRKRRLELLAGKPSSRLAKSHDFVMSLTIS